MTPGKTNTARKTRSKHLMSGATRMNQRMRISPSSSEAKNVKRHEKMGNKSSRRSIYYWYTK